MLKSDWAILILATALCAAAALFVGTEWSWDSVDEPVWRVGLIALLLIALVAAGTALVLFLLGVRREGGLLPSDAPHRWVFAIVLPIAIAVVPVHQVWVSATWTSNEDAFDSFLASAELRALADGAGFGTNPGSHSLFLSSFEPGGDRVRCQIDWDGQFRRFASGQSHGVVVAWPSLTLNLGHLRLSGSLRSSTPDQVDWIAFVRTSVLEDSFAYRHPRSDIGTTVDTEVVDIRIVDRASQTLVAAGFAEAIPPRERRSSMRPQRAYGVDSGSVAEAVELCIEEAIRVTGPVGDQP